MEMAKWLHQFIQCEYGSAACERRARGAAAATASGRCLSPKQVNQVHHVPLAVSCRRSKPLAAARGLGS
jgi:hypothetical protein